MNTVITLLMLALVLVLIWPARGYCRHRVNIAKARRVLKQLAQIEHPGQQFAYLRKIDPFVFEELLLCAYERQGCRVVRNRRYTGDGGIDGRVWISGQLHLIQAKRYSGYIRGKHLNAFAQLCRQEKCPGLFIHTGKSCDTRPQREVCIISGRRLLELLCLSSPHAASPVKEVA